jgi:hypothetical protein
MKLRGRARKCGVKIFPLACQDVSSIGVSRLSTIGNPTRKRGAQTSLTLRVTFIRAISYCASGSSGNFRMSEAAICDVILSASRRRFENGDSPKRNCRAIHSLALRADNTRVLQVKPVQRGFFSCWSA